MEGFFDGLYGNQRLRGWREFTPINAFDSSDAETGTHEKQTALAKYVGQAKRTRLEPVQRVAADPLGCHA
jgi:hypothetical protein